MEEVTLIDTVAALLRAIREQGVRSREKGYYNLFSTLKYKGKTGEKIDLSFFKSKMDALLVKAAIEHFGISPDSDIVLMAFGLLEGYEYQRISLYDRRKNYLRESQYLKTNPRSKIKGFDEATEEEQRREIQNIRKGGEDTPIQSLAGFLIDQDIEEYIKDLDGYITKGDRPIAILPKPSYQIDNLSTNKSTNSDTGVKTISHIDNATIIYNIDNATSYAGPPKAESTSDAIATSSNITHSVDSPGQSGQRAKRPINVGVGVLGILLVFMVVWYMRDPVSTKNEDILLPDNMTIQTGTVQQIKPTLLSEATGGANNIEFEYISSDPDILKVLYSGLLYAENGLLEGESASVELTVRGPHNISKKISITVENAGKDNDYPEIDINNLNLSHTVETKVRRAGSNGNWSSDIDLEVGDKVEIQIAYTNKSNGSQRNVMIRDVMPKNLQYVAGSTVLYNTNHPQGMTIDQDDIITNGINIGNYSANGNAFVRFTATVVDNTLQNGANVLVNWAQGGVGPITLQDYACVEVLKEK